MLASIGEYQLHWRLDVIFNEDKACNDNAAENMNIIRKWSMAVLVKAKKKQSQSVKSLMRRNPMSIQHLIESVNKTLRA
jgi:hypothetical protein